MLRHVPSHWRLLRRLMARMETGQVGLAILIDYGGFNLRVAAAARRAGVPVLYYVTPQVWASRPGRMKVMARVITQAAVILPFEEALLRRHGVKATFVGHPLLDRAAAMPDRDEARRRLGLPEAGEVLALFPGSRGEEIRRHLGDFVDVARRLEAARPGLARREAGADRENGARGGQFERAFERVDVVAMPTSPTPAFKLGERMSDPLQMYLADIFTVSASLAGLPAISVPCGFTASALPIGLQLTGRMFDEPTLFGVAHAYERRTDWSVRRPSQ